jgi:putative endonuclease
VFGRNKSKTKLTAGAAIERAAAIWLQQRGLICIEKNFRCRGGEIDLIMRDRDTVVFVEVRLRNRDDFGSATESVTATKQRRVIHAAHYFLAAHTRWGQHNCRFDVLAAKHTNDTIIWEWVRDAFIA